MEHVAQALLSTSRPRNWVIPIYGAGASITSGVPSGNYLMEMMKLTLNQLKKTARFSEKLGKRATAERRRLSSGRDLSFEQVLEIYSQVFEEEDLYEWLRNRIEEPGLRYFPTFTHEYCAHLVAGGFLKYFLSANFDELLEQALEEELGPASVHRVASLSEFQQLKGVERDDWDSEIGGHQPRCYVLKPHGTISRSRSLRHLQKNTGSFEAAKTAVLKQVLKDSTLLLLGFGNYNHDFWLLFAETCDLGITSDIVIVDLKPKNVRHKFADSISGKNIFCYQGTTDDFFSDLARRLHFHKDLAKRQKPTRHQIRSLFFSLFSRTFIRPIDKTRNDEIIRTLKSIPEHWYCERVYELELLIYLFKTRGLFVDLAAADCPRVRDAYDSCYKAAVNRDLRVSSVLHELLNHSPRPLVASSSVHDRRGKNSLNTQWCFLISRNGKMRTDGRGEARIFQDSADAFSSWIIRKASDACKDVEASKNAHKLLRARVHRKFRTALAKHLKELSQSFDIDITGQHRTTALRFRDPKILRTRAAFAEHTSKILDPSRWNVLRVASVAGEWLVSEFEDQQLNRRFQGIHEINVLGNLDVLTGKAAEGREYRPRELFHFQNMTNKIAALLECLATKSKESGSTIRFNFFALANLAHHMTVSFLGGEPAGGTYFSRIGKNTSISPVLLENLADITDLARYFDSQISVAVHVLEAKAESGRLNLVFNKASTALADLIAALKSRGMEGRTG